MKICIACDADREKYAADHGIFRVKIFRATFPTVRRHRWAALVFGREFSPKVACL
jgi:hypothetical protein